MTLDEFTTEVKRVMQEKGIPLDTPIWYIDVGFPQLNAIEVSAGSVGLAVSE